jgi:hypothetical protein
MVMDSANRFVVKHSDAVVGTLACYDRVIIKGYLPFSDERAANAFVDCGLQIKRKDFCDWADGVAEALVEDAKAAAKHAQAPYQYLQGSHSKDQLAQQAFSQAKGREGLLLVLCVMETCPGYRLAHGEGRPQLVNRQRLQRVLYYYFNDPQFGLMHVRIQTFFPLTIQVYVNGHEWLARQLLQRQIGFEQRDNAFTQCDDWELAQQLADSFDQLDWVRLLDGWAKQVNYLMGTPTLEGRQYYWVADQAEYSTDVVFRDQAALAEIYPSLLDHAVLHFSAEDVMKFLGRKLHGNFLGEVVTKGLKNRAPGARVKHHVKNNWLKMYDKFGQILRVETVINNPREFKVRRCRERQGESQMVWCPMNKGITNLYRYREVSQAANRRYLEALAAVDNPTPTQREVATLVEPQLVGDRRYAGFNPARTEELKIFQAVLHGDHVLRGFRNAEIRERLYASTSTATEHRRQANAVSRVLKRLHVRGLIAKVAHTYRWRVTDRGHQLLSAMITLYYRALPAAV